VGAAAFPLTSITAYEAFFDRLGIDVDGANKGETLLIIGGAGGVGSIGIQLAKIAGLTVIATASRPDTRAWVEKMGADHVVNHRNPLDEEMKPLNAPHLAEYMEATEGAVAAFTVNEMRIVG